MNPPTSPQMPSWDVPHVPPESVDSVDSPVSLPTVDQSSPSTAPLLPQWDSSSPDTARVRFLNAVTWQSRDLRILTGNRLLSSQLSPGSLSEYFTVPTGFRPFSFFDGTSPWLLLFRTAIPLTAGDVVTLALVRSGDSTDLVRIDDRPCGVRGMEYGCLRCVNLVYDSPPLNLLLSDGRAVFTDMRFKETTNFRRADPGLYSLRVLPSPSLPLPTSPHIETVEDLPIVLPDYGTEPLLAFSLELRAAAQATLYFIGDWEISREIQLLAVENF